MMYDTNIADIAIEAKLRQCRDFPKKAYEGVRLHHYCLIRVNGVPLNPKLHLKNFSSGFEWGDAGAGSRQFAYALLADLFGDDKINIMSVYHERLLGEIISILPMQENWLITDTDILSILGGASDFRTQLNRYCRR